MDADINSGYTLRATWLNEVLSFGRKNKNFVYLQAVRHNIGSLLKSPLCSTEVRVHRMESIQLLSGKDWINQ